MQKMSKEKALLISASGIHADGWTNSRATLGITCSQPLQLYFYLPPSPILSKSKAVYVKHGGLQYKVEVERGTITPSAFFTPSNDTVAVEIDCEYVDIKAGRGHTEFGVQVAQISLFGEEPFSFVDFLSNSYKSAQSVKMKGGKCELPVPNSLRAYELQITDDSNGYLKIIARGSSDKELCGKVLIDGISVDSVVLTRSNNLTVSDEHTIDWRLSEEYRDGRPHVFSFELNEGGSEFRTDPIVVQHPKFNVELDQIDYGSITGWVYRVDQASPIWLEVHVNGSLQKTVEAGERRSDVKQAMGTKSERVGFRFEFEAVHAAPSNVVALIDERTKIPIVEVTIADPYRTLTDIATKYRKESAINDVNAVLSTFQSFAPSGPATTVKKRPIRRATVSQREVAIVIPIYGGVTETSECLESVFRAKNSVSCKYILVNDCSPDAILNELVDSIAQEQSSNVVVIRRQKNGGFSSSVNLGIIAAGSRDVILLNADTVVTDGWVDRLVEAASSDETIGTVTPLSNNGEIVTLPYQCRSLVVDDLSVSELVDRIAAIVNTSRPPIDIPVAIGFCMYIKRECLDEIGLFDAKLWGRGYGEEVDFCLKARASGWRHVVTTNTFVVHRGAASFGDEKLKRIVESARKISEIYPFYDELIRNFITQDPIRPDRRSINLSVINEVLQDGRILHVTHAFGGGTERYVQELAEIHRAEGRVPLILRFDSKRHAELEINLAGTKLEGLFDKIHVELFSHREIEDLKVKISELRIDQIHLHSPFGMPIDFIEWLVKSHRFNATIHDYAWICPRATLAQPGGRYCGEPAVDHCDRCISIYNAHPGLSALLSECSMSVERYRERMSKILSRAERVFVGAEDVKARLVRHGIHASFIEQPHPEPTVVIGANQNNVMKSDGRIAVALFGAISEIKGFHKLISIAKYVYQNQLPIKFIVFGYTMNDELASSIGNIAITGRYEENDLDDLINYHLPDIALFPAQWPETYSYTLSHAFRHKLWPIVTDIGAPAERVRRVKFGDVISKDASEAEFCDALLTAALNRSRRFESEKTGE